MNCAAGAATVAERPKHGGKRPGAGRPKAMSDNIAVKFDRALATKAKFVAEAQGVSLASYLANVCRTTIDRDFDRAVEKLRGGEGK